jgi:RNA polymerase sigma factor (TIGR02999 family)
MNDQDSQGTNRSPRRHDITDLLHEDRAGDPEVLSDLARLVYDELHQIAHRQLARERPGQTLQTTGLVHEAFLKFVALERVQVNDREHFYALSARFMRRILTDYARRRCALKRHGVRVPIDRGDTEASGHEEMDVEALIDLDHALDELAELSERCARVVECRFFSGMTVEETGHALGVSTATVMRDWDWTRAWLNRRLQ